MCQERHRYDDPVTSFLACLYIDFDFDGAQQKLKQCEEVLFTCCCCLLVLC